MNWNDYPNFKREEFSCRHTGENDMQPEFMEKLQLLRTLYGKPMRITSGYRSIKHPVEASKRAGGTHTTGRACDVAVEGSDALLLVKLALQVGFTGIGVQQKGSGRFIHLDDVTDKHFFSRPMIWSY
jgi:zinc D-Ala-D-Ala carboxypeptidase